MNGVRSYLLDGREAAISRWHGRFTLQTETLAAHHGRCARATAMICHALRELEIAWPDTLAAVEMAMLHDAAEVSTGDVQGWAKLQYPALKETLTRIEHEVIADGLFADLPSGLGDHYRAVAQRIADPVPDDLEAQVVGYADKLEAWRFVQQELRLGNATMHDPTNDAEATTAQALARMIWPWLRRLRQATDLP